MSQSRFNNNQVVASGGGNNTYEGSGSTSNPMRADKSQTKEGGGYNTKQSVTAMNHINHH